MQSVALLQFNSGPLVESNLAAIAPYIAKAKTEGAQLIVLPENFAQMRSRKEPLHQEVENDGMVQNWLQQQALENDIWILAGSVPIVANLDQQKNPFSRSLLFNNKGELAAFYDKIHLYDVDAPDGKTYRESDDFTHGNSLFDNMVVSDTPLGKLGLTICYDLRFPELFRELTSQGAELIVVPAAFTYETGKAHWETLLKARAIENSVYILACGQVGVHASGRSTWGHSMVIDPWGEIIAQKGEQEGLVIAKIDLTKLDQLRNSFPSFSHRRLFIKE